MTHAREPLFLIAVWWAICLFEPQASKSPPSSPPLSQCFQSNQVVEAVQYHEGGGGQGKMHVLGGRESWVRIPAFLCDFGHSQGRPDLLLLVSTLSVLGSNTAPLMGIKELSLRQKKMINHKFVAMALICPFVSAVKG